jgi:nicotinate-nucleotide pyrophosphorylase (carboxylating)
LITSTDYLNSKSINQFIDQALAEDVGSGDHSSLGSIPEITKVKAILKIKEDGIIAGMELAKLIFDRIDPQLNFNPLITDGEPIYAGDVAFDVAGNARSILMAERIVLNCMQRMSGIATKTRSMTNLIKNQKARLLDTRKTTPNFRLAEKWAVKIGGGTNHRFGLYDMIMLKDNHIDFAGGIKPAILATKEYLNKTDLDLKIEVETRSLKEVKDVVEVGGVSAILLDNMMPSDMRIAVEMVDSQFITEASGGITEITIKEIAECGVDYISVGALTHSFKSLDMSLKADKT